MEDKYNRKVQCSVTNFIFCGDEYLFLKRKSTKRIDPGKLNGVGGRVEPGEDYLTAAIRETKEETGYKVSVEDIKLVCVGRLEGGYDEDWVMCFFKIKVLDKKIPHGENTDDGELIWLHKDNVLDSNHDLVDDLDYVFKDIVEDNLLIFCAKVGDDQKIQEISISKAS